jgi:hypothetical protein
VGRAPLPPLTLPSTVVTVRVVSWTRHRTRKEGGCTVCYVADACKRGRMSVLARCVPPGWRSPVVWPVARPGSISLPNRGPAGDGQPSRPYDRAQIAPGFTRARRVCKVCELSLSFNICPHVHDSEVLHTACPPWGCWGTGRTAPRRSRSEGRGCQAFFAREYPPRPPPHSQQ